MRSRKEKIAETLHDLAEDWVRTACDFGYHHAHAEKYRVLFQKSVQELLDILYPSEVE